MNKQYALEVLNEVKNTSPRFIKEYGISLVKEALRYISNLNTQRKVRDSQIDILLDSVQNLVHQIS